jgi:immunoglobulin-like protein involved in spore germination
MTVFPPITVRQPRPHDLVDDPVGVCGIGTGFEGVISARVRDNKRHGVAADAHPGRGHGHLG